MKIVGSRCFGMTGPTAYILAHFSISSFETGHAAVCVSLQKDVVQLTRHVFCVTAMRLFMV